MRFLYRLSFSFSSFDCAKNCAVCSAVVVVAFARPRCQESLSERERENHKKKSMVLIFQQTASCLLLLLLALSSGGMDRAGTAGCVAADTGVAYPQGMTLQLHRVADHPDMHSETYRRRRLQNIDGNLEVVPLNPGLGTHYAWVYAGTPPQRASVIADTGSGLMAFPCSGCVKATPICFWSSLWLMLWRIDERRLLTTVVLCIVCVDALGVETIRINRLLLRIRLR